MKLTFGRLPAGLAVADGAWATSLFMRGYPLNIAAELANVTHGHLVAVLAKEYVQAGVEILSTNTFGANALQFARRGIAADINEVNVKGATIARNIAHDQLLVAGSLGPTGALLAIREVGEDRITQAYADQARALVAGGVDLLVLETFTELPEILLALAAVKSVTNLPVVASMSFDSGPQRARTLMGATAEQAAAALDEAGADAIGSNCGAGIAAALPAVVALRANTKKPLWIKPSVGLPDLEEGRPVYHHTPDEFGGFVPALIDAGANILGGCCGAGPEHIRRIAALVASRRRKH